MKKSFVIIVLSVCSVAASAQSYKKITQKAIVADSHNDILTACIEKNVSMDHDLRGKTQSDLARFKQGGVDVQLFSVWCDGEKQAPYAWANREMDTLYAVTARNPEKIQLVHNIHELKKAVKQGKLAAMFGVEGGHMIENSLDKLDTLYARGARYLTLTWNNSTSWATSAMDETLKADSLTHTHKGLTDFGKAVIRHMNEIGMMVDLSHVGEQTFWDAIHTTTKPVIVSHSNAWAVCPVFRNLKDDQILAVGKNGGVIDLNFYSGFVDSGFERKQEELLAKHKAELDAMVQKGMQKEYAMGVLTDRYADEVKAIRPTLEQLLKHLDHIVQLIGADHVGIGSDFDGITSPPQDLDDVTTYPLITKALLARGYNRKDIDKILGGNILRVLKANEPK